MSAVPKTCKLRIRRIVNKLTLVNVVGCARDLCQLFVDGSFSRAEVLTVFSEELVTTFTNTHVCTHAVLCSYSGVVRGLQLLHGSSSGTIVVESVVETLRKSLSASNDTAAGNCGGFLSFLYILGGVSNHLIAGMISSCASEFGDAGLSCCLSVLKCCGAKLVAEIPAELNKIVRGLESHGRTKRGDMLLSVCQEMVRAGPVSKVSDSSVAEGVASSLLELVGDKDKHTSRRRLATQNASEVLWTPLAGEAPAAEDERATKRRRIEIERTKEKAVSGQRFASEAKREIFGCIANASDDVDCFHSLVNRDPSFSQLSDTFAVLLQCCVREPLPNVFYANVIQRLACSKKTFKNILQYALWDRFKAIRIDQADLTGFINLAALLGELLVADVFDLQVLRGLDLEETSKSIGFFTRVLLLRLFVSLSSEKLTSLFFTLSCNRKVDDSLRACLSVFVDRYFVDDQESSRWIPLIFDVVAHKTPFAEVRNLPAFAKRIEGVAKALKVRSF
jgi:nucleolar MIF4G domain-containing protein 1